MNNCKTHIWLLRPSFWGILTFFLLASACVFIFWPFTVYKSANDLTVICVPVFAVWIVTIVIIVYLSRVPGRLHTPQVKKIVAVEKSEIRNKAMVNALPDMIFIIDRDGYYIDFNIPPSQHGLVNPKISFQKRYQIFYRIHWLHKR